jgi:hypothetical protein
MIPARSTPASAYFERRDITLKTESAPGRGRDREWEGILRGFEVVRKASGFRVFENRWTLVRIPTAAFKAAHQSDSHEERFRASYG